MTPFSPVHEVTRVGLDDQPHFPATGPVAAAPRIPDYELLRLIGRGSYGDVWLARGVTGIYRAIKVVWRERFADAEPFEREFHGLKEFAAISLGERVQLALLHALQARIRRVFRFPRRRPPLSAGRKRSAESDPARDHTRGGERVSDRRLFAGSRRIHRPLSEGAFLPLPPL